MMPRPSADMETMGRHYLSGVLHRNPVRVTGKRQRPKRFPVTHGDRQPSHVLPVEPGGTDTRDVECLPVASSGRSRHIQEPECARHDNI